MSATTKRSAPTGGSQPAKKGKFEKGAFKGKKPNPFNAGPHKGNKPNHFAKAGNANGKKFPNKFSKPTNESKPNAPPVAPEKVDWNKFKKDKKELKLKRKSQNDLYTTVTEAKKIYEVLKCKSTPNKAELCRDLNKLFKSPEIYQKLVMAHDTARIIQCMLKHSPAEICEAISKSLVPIMSKLAISVYASFCVPRLLKHGSNDIKQKVIEAMYGNVLMMCGRAKPAALIDSLYISYASSQQKAFMRQEFYGDLYKKSKDKNVKCIKDTYESAPHMKMAVLNSVKSNLNHIINKKLIDNSLVHAVLVDYFAECSEEDKAEMITSLIPHMPAFATTKDGVHASMICFWNSIVKDRRAIVKLVREHLTKLCVHEFGHIFILAIVNSMDDTKALKKAIFDHIISEIEVIAATEYGRKTIEWFIAPADTATFHPHTVAFLEEGLQFSKKDKETRRAELREAVDEPLCKAIAEKPDFWLRGGHIALTVAAILKNCKEENAKKALDALASIVCDADWMVPLKENVEENKESKKIKKLLEAHTEEEDKDEKIELVAGIDHAGLHIALKKLLKLTKFSSSLAEKLTKEVVEKWIPLNRASFLLLNAFENGDAAAQDQVKLLIANNKGLLKKQSHAASKLLITKLGF